MSLLKLRKQTLDTKLILTNQLHLGGRHGSIAASQLDLQFDPKLGFGFLPLSKTEVNFRVYSLREPRVLGIGSFVTVTRITCLLKMDELTTLAVNCVNLFVCFP